MSEIVVEKFDDNVLWPGKICYALYKRYPNGFRFFLGHFRAKYDYDAEVEWLDAHEKDPEPVYYVAKEVSDWKLKNICDSAKYAEKLKARVKERWEAKQKASKEYKEWKAELVAKGMTEGDLPLSKRKMPPLLGEPTLADMYHYCMFDADEVGAINANLHSEGLPDCSHALVFTWKLHKKSGFFWTKEGFFDEKGNPISVVGSSQSPTGQK